MSSRSQESLYSSHQYEADDYMKEHCSVMIMSNKSTGFNVDDYISSDDDSFTTKTIMKQPCAEGEEELLFRDQDGYGESGGALPGLSLGLCPAPTLLDDDSFTMETIMKRPCDEGEEELLFRDQDGYGESGGALPGLSPGVCPAPRLFDARSGVIPPDSPMDYPVDNSVESADCSPIMDYRFSTSLPSQRLHELQSSLENERNSENQTTPENQPAGRRFSLVNKPKINHTHDHYHDQVDERNMSKECDQSCSHAQFHSQGMYDGMAPPRQGLKRLSALGTLHGRKVNRNSDQTITSAADLNKEEDQEREEKVDVATAIRKRKEDKARQRAAGENQQQRRSRLKGKGKAV